jgi:2-dehydropantoate 2-reductase
MARGVREGFAAMRALRFAVTPFPLRVLFTWTPPAFAVAYWRRFFASKTAEYVFGRHARSASHEMGALAEDCRALLAKSGVEAVALRTLYDAIDSYRARREGGSVRR